MSNLLPLQILRIISINENIMLYYTYNLSHLSVILYYLIEVLHYFFSFKNGMNLT